MHPLPSAGTVRLTALTVLSLTSVIGAVFSLMAWQTLRVQEAAQAHTRFERSVTEAERALTEAMADYEQLLWSGAALFSASSNVTREEWRAFADGVQLDTRFPGLKGFGFAQVLTPAERAAHEAALRESGRPGYAIRPPGDRDMLTSIVYLEPEVPLPIGCNWVRKRVFPSACLKSRPRACICLCICNGGDHAASSRP